MTQHHRSTTQQSDVRSKGDSTGSGTGPGTPAGPHASGREEPAGPDAHAEPAAAAHAAARGEAVAVGAPASRAEAFVSIASQDEPAPLSRPPVLPAPRPLGELRLWPRSFTHRLTAPLPGIRAFARFAREGAIRPRPEGLADIPRLPFEPGLLPVVDAGTVALTWAGHASWVIRIGGLTVLTDPVWSRKILGTPARVTPVGVAWDALPAVDAVVISHNHYDHLDAPTIARLPRDTAVFVPAGLARWFRRRRFTRVTELDWWEAAETGGVRFDFVPAHHWSKRRLNDTCRSLWGGWVLTDPAGQRVYFAGDSGYGHWFSRIGHRYPAIDVALLPIGAYDPRWWLRDVHCNPEEAVQAVRDLGARRMAPMHWATFLLSAEPVLEPLTRVRTAWEKAGLAREDLWDLPVGGSRVLEV